MNGVQQPCVFDGWQRIKWLHETPFMKIDHSRGIAGNRNENELIQTHFGLNRVRSVQWEVEYPYLLSVRKQAWAHAKASIPHCISISYNRTYIHTSS